MGIEIGSVCAAAQEFRGVVFQEFADVGSFPQIKYPASAVDLASASLFQTQENMSRRAGIAFSIRRKAERRRSGGRWAREPTRRIAPTSKTVKSKTSKSPTTTSQPLFRQASSASSWERSKPQTSKPFSLSHFMSRPEPHPTSRMRQPFGRTRQKGPGRKPDLFYECFRSSPGNAPCRMFRFGLRACLYCSRLFHIIAVVLGILMLSVCCANLHNDAFYPFELPASKFVHGHVGGMAMPQPFRHTLQQNRE